MRPGSSGVAAKLPNKPGNQKLTPPSSAKEGVGMQAQRTAPAPKAHRRRICVARQTETCQCHLDAPERFASSLKGPIRLSAKGAIRLSARLAYCLTKSALRPSADCRISFVCDAKAAGTSRRRAQWSEDGMNLLRRSLASETFSDLGSFPPDPRTAEATRRLLMPEPIGADLPLKHHPDRERAYM